jgi:hypothetical protein
MTSHRTCSHLTTASARATCRRERAAAADELRREYAHVLAKRVLFGLEECDVCPDDGHHARHYGRVRDVLADPRYIDDPRLLVFDEESMSHRYVNLSEVELVKE